LPKNVAYLYESSLVKA